MEEDDIGEDAVHLEGECVVLFEVDEEYTLVGNGFDAGDVEAVGRLEEVEDVLFGFVALAHGPDIRKGGSTGDAEVEFAGGRRECDEHLVFFLGVGFGQDGSLGIFTDDLSDLEQGMVMKVHHERGAS